MKLIMEYFLIVTLCKCNNAKRFTKNQRVLFAIQYFAVECQSNSESAPIERNKFKVSIPFDR